jgi:proline dehydrogenase
VRGRAGDDLRTGGARAAGVRAVFATHDLGLLGRLHDHAWSLGLGRDAFECHMLLGVRRGYQRRLATQGYPVRALVSCGEAWLEWYVRRLAERPANLGVLLRGLLG